MITELIIRLPVNILQFFLYLLPQTWDMPSAFYDSLSFFAGEVKMIDAFFPVFTAFVIFDFIVAFWLLMLAFKALLFFYSFIRGGIRFDI